ncbi:uncharacterized protein [Muntiacus reevesi]|uniref:uncharacterized protein n=1 Tax=Muntiacus reevesi TaxID=9886 RepID=UPI0033071893
MGVAKVALESAFVKEEKVRLVQVLVIDGASPSRLISLIRAGSRIHNPRLNSVAAAERVTTQGAQRPGWYFQRPQSLTSTVAEAPTELHRHRGPRLSLAGHAAALSPAPGFKNGNVFESKETRADTLTHARARPCLAKKKKKKNGIKGKGWPQKLVVWLKNKQTNTLAPVRSHLSLTPATISPNAPTWDGLSTFAVPWRKVRKQGPRSRGRWLGPGPGTPSCPGVLSPLLPLLPTPGGHLPASCAVSRTSRRAAWDPVSQRTHICRGARRAEKRNLLLPKGKTILLKVAERLKSISKASSGLYVLSQAGTAAGETRMDTVVEKSVVGGASPGTAELRGRFEGNLTLRSW